MDAFSQTLASTGFMPHGHCFLWTPTLLWAYVLSDSLIALAYYSIPLTLWYFVRRRSDVPFSAVFMMFAVFIFACGTTHVVAVWNIWSPAYWLDASLKALTAGASVATAVVLWPLVPKALSLSSPRQLELVNRKLLDEIAARRRAEEDLQALNQQLERRVAERTAEIAAANEELTRRDLEQQQAAQSLRESQQLLQSIIDNTSTVIYVKRLDGRYLLVNRRFEELFHVTLAGMQATTDHDMFPAEHADALRAVDVQVARTGETVVTEELVPLDDGLHAYLSTKFAIRDTEGGIFAVAGISADITDRKQSEQRLQAQLQRMSLLDQITCAIGERQDLRSIFQVVVQSLEQRLPADFSCVCRHGEDSDTATPLAAVCVGGRNQELADNVPISTALTLTYEPDAGAVDEPFAQRLARAGLRSMVVAPLQAQGRVFGMLVAARCQASAFSSGECEFLRQLSAHVALAAQQAELHGALQQAYDDLRQTQQAVMQQERLRALGQMASGIAHDINNAISPVTLYTEALLEREPDLSATGREYLQNIARAIDDVAATVARMREFYRQREPQLTLTPVPLNLLVQQVVDLTRARWSDMPQQRGVVIRLETDLASDVPPVMGVESEIREALINLVFNAVDAMPEGGTLVLRTRAAASRVQLDAVDSGIGMDENTRRRCLEPFFTTKGERGTGLGLAMVYGVMQRHGGDVGIESVPGQGTTIRLSFAQAQLPATLMPRPAEPPDVPAAPRHILLVDDDPLLLHALRDTLQTEGHRVSICAGGQEGIAEVRRSAAAGVPFDVVITDLGMPYVDGRKVASAVKQARSDTLVILLTGWGQRLLGDGDVPVDVDLVLSKPPKLRELRDALASRQQVQDRRMELE